MRNVLSNQPARTTLSSSRERLRSVTLGIMQGALALLFLFTGGSKLAQYIHRRHQGQNHLTNIHRVPCCARGKERKAMYVLGQFATNFSCSHSKGGEEHEMQQTMQTVISKDGTPIAFDQPGQRSPLILVVGAFNTRSTGAP